MHLLRAPAVWKLAEFVDGWRLAVGIVTRRFEDVETRDQRGGYTVASSTEEHDLPETITV